MPRWPVCCLGWRRLDLRWRDDCARDTGFGPGQGVRLSYPRRTGRAGGGGHAGQGALRPSPGARLRDGAAGIFPVSEFEAALEGARTAVACQPDAAQTGAVDGGLLLLRAGGGAAHGAAGGGAQGEGGLAGAVVRAGAAATGRRSKIEPASGGDSGAGAGAGGDAVAGVVAGQRRLRPDGAAAWRTRVCWRSRRKYRNGILTRGKRFCRRNRWP